MKSFNFPNISSQNFKTFYCDPFRKHSDCLHCNVFKLRPDRVEKNNRYRSMEKKNTKKPLKMLLLQIKRNVQINIRFYTHLKEMRI